MKSDDQCILIVDDVPRNIQLLGSILKEENYELEFATSGKEALESDDVWIIDPIDGTLNFATGIPLFAVMVAHMHKGVIRESAISLPSTDELFFATSDGASLCNGQKIAHSSKADLGRSRGCVSTPASARSLTFLLRLNKSLSSAPVQTSSYGSMGIHACYVASGRRDWVVS